MVEKDIKPKNFLDVNKSPQELKPPNSTEDSIKIDTRYQQLENLVRKVASEFSGSDQEAFSSLPTNYKNALVLIGEGVRKTLLEAIRRAKGFTTDRQIFETINRGTPSNQFDPSLLSKTERKTLSSQKIFDMIQAAISGVIEVREKESKSPFWSLGQRAHQVIEALHSGHFQKLFQESGKSPFWRHRRGGIEIFDAEASFEQEKLALFVDSKEKVIFSSSAHPQIQGKPVFMREGGINPVIKSCFTILRDPLLPFPSTPFSFEKRFRLKRWQKDYFRLESKVKDILPPWTQMREECQDSLSKFALASTVFSITREMIDPLIQPNKVPLLTEIPFGFFPILLDVGEAKKKEVLLTVGKPDAIAITSINGKPPDKDFVSWLNNLKSRYKGDYNFRNVLAKVYLREGLGAKISLEIIEHKMQVGDAGPNACLDFLEITKGPSFSHLRTLREYMFGALMVNVLVRQMLKKPGKILGNFSAQKMEEFNSRPDRFMKRLDIVKLEKILKNENLSITGKLVYHFPETRVVYKERLDYQNLKRVWDESLSALFNEALLIKETSKAILSLTSMISHKEGLREVLVGKTRKVPEGWEKLIVRERNYLYLDPVEFLKKAKLVSWLDFEKDKVLKLKVLVDGEPEEIRINFKSLNFRLQGCQGRVRLAKYYGLLLTGAQKKETSLVWQELWGKKKTIFPGESLEQKVYQDKDGQHFQGTTEGGIHWNSWQNRHEISLKDLSKQVNPKLQILFKLVTLGKGGQFHCPFEDHEDSTSSAYFYVKERRVYCFGCTRSVSITPTPREFLGDGSTQETGVNLKPIRLYGGFKEEKNLLPVSAERGRILGITAEYFKKQFKDSPAWDYLADKRGIDPLRALSLGLVGYADGQLASLIQSGELPLDLQKAVAHGLVVEDAKKPGNFYDFLRGMIVFPQAWTGEENVFKVETGRVTNFIGRSLEEKRFLKLRVGENGAPHGIFGWDVVDMAKEKNQLVIVEAAIDALTLRIQLDFDKKKIPVVALIGFGDKEVLELIRALGIKRLIFGFDNDEAGQKAFERIKEKIGSGFKIITLTSLLIDINSELNPDKTRWLRRDLGRPWKDPNEMLTETVVGQKYQYQKS